MAKSVLIIDDDRELISEMGEILTEEGFVVEKTHNPIEGRTMVLSRQYDIILLDYKMPGMNGIELINEIKQKIVKSVIILITGSLNMEQMLKDANCDSLVKGIITKPFDVEELIKTLKKI